MKATKKCGDPYEIRIPTRTYLVLSSIV